MPDIPAPTVSQIHGVPISDIEIGTYNVRLTNADKDLDELAASIKLQGLLQPIVLTGEFGKPPYQLVSGQRRLLAHEKILAATHIQAVFVGNITRTEAVIRSLVENLQRADLEFRDTEVAITELYKKLGSEAAIKEATGLSIRRIRSHLMIGERASQRMKDYIASGKVSVADVKRSLQAARDDIAKAERLLDLIIELKPTAHEKRRLVKYGAKSPEATADEIFEDALKPHVEQKLVISLGEEIRTALAEATKSLEMDNPAELAERIISEWLEQEGFRSEGQGSS